MKRTVILIDGTWNNEGHGDDIAKLDPNYHAVTGNPLIKATADGTAQRVFYHAGVGAEPDIVKKVLGGAIGIGLKQIIQDAYTTLVQNYAGGDEIYIFGFSRGAYAARALAGLIGASGIQRTPDRQGFEIAWSHYRVDPKTRGGGQRPNASDKKTIDTFNDMASQGALHSDRTVKCVGVFDTVGSYGILRGSASRCWRAILPSKCSAFTIPNSANTSTLACTPLRSTSDAGHSCRRSGLRPRTTRRAVMSSRPGSLVSTAMSVAAMRTPGCRTGHWSG